MLNILWIPQISSLSSDGYVYLPKDSNMTAIGNLLKSDLGKNKIDLCFEFSNENVIENKYVFDNVSNVFWNKNHKYTNNMLERYHLDVDYFMSIYEGNERYDIIFCNEPTKVDAMKEIFKTSKVVCYNHWLAFKNMKNIQLRQYEGMCNASACFVNSEYAKKSILDYYDSIGKIKNLKKINLIVSNPAFNTEIKKFEGLKSRNIIYNHRLSSDIYYSKAFNDFLMILLALEYRIGIDNMPIVYLTNPSVKKFDYNLPKYFKQIQLLDKIEYEMFLKSNNVGIHMNTFFDSEGMWSQSTVDCAVAGNICLLPFKYGYAEMFDSRYFGYCNDREEMLDKLAYILDNKNENKLKNLFTFYDSFDKIDGIKVGNKLLKDLEKIVEGEE